MRKSFINFWITNKAIDNVDDKVCSNLKRNCLSIKINTVVYVLGGNMDLFIWI